MHGMLGNIYFKAPKVQLGKAEFPNPAHSKQDLLLTWFHLVLPAGYCVLGQPALYVSRMISTRRKTGIVSHGRLELYPQSWHIFSFSSLRQEMLVSLIPVVRTGFGWKSLEKEFTVFSRLRNSTLMELIHGYALGHSSCGGYQRNPRPGTSVTK